MHGFSVREEVEKRRILLLWALHTDVAVWRNLLFLELSGPKKKCAEEYVRLWHHCAAACVKDDNEGAESWTASSWRGERTCHDVPY